MKVAYVMSRFAKLSETFILLEILALVRRGVDVSIYPLILEQGPRHAEVAQVADRVRHVSPRSWAVVRAVAHFLRRAPRPLLGAVWQVTWSNLGPTRSFLATLATIPRAIWMARDMERRGIEHVHAHFATHATTAAFLVRRLTGIPFSFTGHHSDLLDHRRMLREKMEEAAFVVTISKLNRDFLAEIGGERIARAIHVVHCGVDTATFRAPEAPGARDGGPFQILCVGRLTDLKGQIHLVEACRLLKERGVPVRCTLIGDGERRAWLERRIAAAGLAAEVELRGGQSHDVVLEAMRRADAVALPSLREGIPVVLMEALACERPVVASRVSGIPELITHDEHGLLVEACRPDQLADALARLWDDPALGRRLGAAGRRKVLREFDLEANAAKLMDLFVAHAGRPPAAAG